MRIYEIDDQDRVWAKLNGLNLDLCEYEYQIPNILYMLSKNLGTKRETSLQETLRYYRERLTIILGADLANDETTKELKDNCIYLINQIDRNI